MILVYITTSNEDESIAIGKKLVEERLCACSNVIGNVKSIYWWENEIENDDESILLLKTIEKNLDKVISRVKEIHSYENPAIFAIPILKVSDRYLEWLNNQID
ncbi:MAG: divalent-cation tolerance protein CutA [Methanobrevibacter sp.]|jgi:periplasmic divalent cation tolerance protein|nr:divalent-cation tolerance protein CutA [Candidatus Methanoflexus mossambicus]